MVDLLTSDSFGMLGEVFRSGMSRLAPSDLYEILVFGTGDRSTDVFVGTPGGFTAEEQRDMLDFLTGNPARHPVTQYHAMGHDAFPVQVTDLISLNAWRSTEFYNRYNRRWGHDHELDCILPEACTDGTVSVSLARGSRSYNARETETLRQMLKPMTLAIRRLLAGRLVDRWVSGKSIESAVLHEMFPRLTSREAEILGWLAEGKSDGEIAVIIGIKRMTASTHVRNIISKLEVENRLSAAMLVVRSLVRRHCASQVEPSAPRSAAGRSLLSLDSEAGDAH